MVTIKGQKMGKSLGNFITLDQLFSGENQVLEQAYSPMTIRFFILQAHYRSPLDFSNEALKAAQKGYERLMTAVAALTKKGCESDFFPSKKALAISLEYKYSSGILASV